MTPLYFAAYHGQLEIVKELIEHGADIDKPTHKGASPLFIAAREGHLEIT
jgi:ankyrin repeat protein